MKEAPAAGHVTLSDLRKIRMLFEMRKCQRSCKHGRWPECGNCVTASTI
jgi:hypothetical protein